MRTALKRHRWWITRLAVLPVHLFFYAVAVFFLVRLIPGNPVTEILGNYPVSASQIAAAEKSLGLTGSEFDQLRTYLGNVVTLKFGDSLITDAPVLNEIGQRLPQTIEVVVIAIIGSAILTVLVTIIVVLRPRGITARLLVPWARSPGAVPDFVLGVAGIFLFYSILRWAPAPLGLYSIDLSPPRTITSFPLLDALLTGDWTLFLSMISHLILPETVLIVTYSPALLNLFIRGFEDAIDAPPTWFRIASGAPRSTVLLSIIRRAAPATVTTLGMMFGYTLGGVVVIEQLFGLPGMGQFMIDAVNDADLVSIEAFLLVVGALSLIVYLLVDIANMMIDPRRRPGTASEGESS